MSLPESSDSIFAGVFFCRCESDKRRNITNFAWYLSQTTLGVWEVYKCLYFSNNLLFVPEPQAINTKVFNMKAKFSLAYQLCSVCCSCVLLKVWMLAWINGLDEVLEYDSYHLILALKMGVDNNSRRQCIVATCFRIFQVFHWRLPVFSDQNGNLTISNLTVNVRLGFFKLFFIFRES